MVRSGLHRPKGKKYIKKGFCSLRGLSVGVYCMCSLSLTERVENYYLQTGVIVKCKWLKKKSTYYFSTEILNRE